MLQLILVCIVFGLITYYLFKKRQFQRLAFSDLDEFPTPWSLPYIGSVLQMDSSKPHQTMYRWARQLGDAFVFRAFGKPHLVINSKDGLYEILVTRGDDFGGRPYMYRADLSFANCQNVTFQNISPKWKMLRKESHKAVKQYGDGLKTLESISLTALNEMISRFEERKDKAFDPRSDIYETFAQIVLMLIVGDTVSREDPMLKVAIDMEKGYCDGFMGAADGFLLDIFPWLRHVGNTSYKMLKQAMDDRDKLWNHYLPELKKTHISGQERGIFDALYTAQKRQREGNADHVLTDEAINMTLTDIVNGGIATTTSTLYAFLNILLHNPEVQTKMQEEIDRVIGQRQIKIDDKHSMPYTRAVILELLRYTTVGSLGLPHETICDTKYKEFHIPKGTFVIPNLWAVNHDPKSWPKPWKFMPERFLDDKGELLLPDHPTRKGFMPFGAGTRVCLGESLAKNRLFLAIVIIVQRMNLIAPEDDRDLISCDPRTYRFGGILYPQSFEVKMVSRHGRPEPIKN